MNIFDFGFQNSWFFVRNVNLLCYSFDSQLCELKKYGMGRILILFSFQWQKCLFEFWFSAWIAIFVVFNSINIETIIMTDLNSSLLLHTIFFRSFCKCFLVNESMWIFQFFVLFNTIDNEIYLILVWDWMTSW